ncbi:hypothetical protein BN381_50007 [Candidatus Microthrix parvicella RN1]|uniref:Uncharacterized protein n=1 Tax=Candidatus Neomicrothrix parvicella RN1 TaxID=1229780 RepID=R4Z2J2_9ACTN|nr:hypothetical protein BN381_50007 [Candidatus Microthrix parvicella RN1]
MMKKPRRTGSRSRRSSYEISPLVAQSSSNRLESRTNTIALAIGITDRKQGAVVGRVPMY